MYQGVFPQLVLGIHQTDVAHHPIVQVVILYYEVLLRYFKVLLGTTTEKGNSKVIPSSHMEYINTVVGYMINHPGVGIRHSQSIQVGLDLRQ